ncbi:MAG: single-stranded DNA-binding protein [Oscillospiraceae bacterium]|nr:single-stranded DNA-binding protein [Oscillospiraceae bacterium]
MEADFRTNFVSLKGLVDAAPKFSHESHGREYFIFPLAVERLSGTLDVINVLVRRDELDETPLHRSDSVALTGQLRSFNNKSGTGSKLILTVLARNFEYGYGEFENTVELSGALCKPPIYRQTPLGREICDMMLAVNRHYGRVDYLPCIAWGENARFCGTLAVGDKLSVAGRIQSRRYIKVINGENVEKTAFEVSALQVCVTEDS